MSSREALPVLGPIPWRRQLASGARTVEALVARGLVAPADVAAVEAVTDRFEVLVSDYYLSLIDPDDPLCPIRKMALPAADELVLGAAERTDPIGDRAHSPAPSIVHRYPDRALLIVTHRCPMFCRYCFRKVALNAGQVPLQQMEAAYDYLRRTPAIGEIILTGGDPLMLSTARLDQVLCTLGEIPSIGRIRIHSRIPVTLPMRVDDDLVECLTQHAPLHLVTHFNHPREMTAVAKEAIDRLRRSGVIVANQAVLLAGINDDVSIQAALWSQLVDWGVRPYYLHHPDLTVGTQHFRVSIDAGLALVRALRGAVSGLCQPTYVIDIPGGLGKVPVDSGYVQADGPGCWWLTSPLTGERVAYTDPAAPGSGEYAPAL
jgi:lysine 2,3-aminomutase